MESGPQWTEDRLDSKWGPKRRERWQSRHLADLRGENQKKVQTSGTNIVSSDKVTWIAGAGNSGSSYSLVSWDKGKLLARLYTT